MIGVVNADPSILADYKKNASQVAKAVTPREVFGGVIATAESSSGDNGSSGNNGKDNGAAASTTATVGGAAFGFALALLVACI
jgi:hypothetical protein